MNNFAVQLEEYRSRHHTIQNMLPPIYTVSDSDSEESDTQSSTQKIKLDGNSTFYDLFELIAEDPDVDIEIELYEGSGLAIGDGAARQFYLRCIDQLIELGAFVVEGCYMNVNPSNGFWQEEIYIQCFVRLVQLILKDGLLPYHLSPLLLGYLMGRELDAAEREYFLDKKDPILSERLADGKATAIIVDELGYEDKADYINYLLDIHFHPTSDKYQIIKTIYNNIYNYYHISPVKRFETVIDLDRHISGEYKISCDTIYNMIKTENFTTQRETLWKQFIYSLNNEELRNMLLTFTNSLSINQNILIKLGKMEHDFQIQTCHKIVILNRRLFKNINTLGRLKLSFIPNDKISDVSFGFPEEMMNLTAMLFVNAALNIQ